MKMQLIKGTFEKNDAIEILNRLVQIKIHYHENKIEKSDNEEDIKMREQRIKELHHEISKINALHHKEEQYIDIEGFILIN